MIGNKIEVTATKEKPLPRHVGIIMDGNGRWAKKRLLPRSSGHKAGLQRMMGLLETAYDMGIEQVTVYALSTENLKRPQEELDGLFELIKTYFSKYMKKLTSKGVKLNVLGDMSLLPNEVVKTLETAVKESERNGDKYVLNVALAYGGRQEIVKAVNELIKSGEEITEKSISEHLYTKGSPDPDLIIRTGGELRLSNFLLYQSAYSELYFSKKMFPSFTNNDFIKAVEDYSSRTRRFGKTDEQCKNLHKGE